MKRTIVPRMNRAQAFLLASVWFFAPLAIVLAQDVQHLSVTVPGGMPGTPLITGLQETTNGLVMTWDGPSGYYQLFEKVEGAADFTPVGPKTNLVRRALINPEHASAQFKIFGPAPHYAGVRACAECHGNIVETESQTEHPHALEVLQQIGQANNPACLPCHTVGFSLPTGFISQAETPHLAGVQCENCHGPAANHAANPDDFTVRPRVELAATVCGGCHTGPHQPTYDEWVTTGHAEVVEDMNPSGRINSCGRCHSGSARLALLHGDPLPAGDANIGITCAVCHDPHRTTANPAQLRNPVASMHNYSLSTGDVFAEKYDPTVNICAQCHNDRGASWTSSSRPPHHSVQYNMLIGTVGLLANGEAPNDPAAHAFLEKQCVSCHMQTKEFTSNEDPAVTGHKFRVESFELCRDCHSQPEGLVEFTMATIGDQIDQVKQALDTWAATKAPEALRTKYGIRAWEYTNPGTLSSGGTGPTSGEQALIPDNIKKARYNMYLVLYDGSFGVHNGTYAVELLSAALDWVHAELSK